MKSKYHKMAKSFECRGIDRFYLEGSDGHFHRQRQLETSSAVSAMISVEDLEKAGFQVAVCAFPMSKYSSLRHIVVYASNDSPKLFAASVARLIELGSGRILNKLFLAKGKVSDRPIGGVDDITLVTAV